MRHFVLQTLCDYLTILPHVPNKKERTHTCALYYLTLFGRVTNGAQRGTCGTEWIVMKIVKRRTVVADEG